MEGKEDLAVGSNPNPNPTNMDEDSSNRFAFVPLTTPSNTKAKSDSHIAYSSMSLKVVEEIEQLYIYFN